LLVLIAQEHLAASGGLSETWWLTKLKRAIILEEDLHEIHG
jgi:hypothetical protein